jgi:hypothetical protein
MRWSIADPEPSSFAEVQKSIKLAVVQANAFIWELSDFPFQNKKEVLMLSKGQSAVLAPKGSIKNIRLEGKNRALKEISVETADAFDSAQTGTPTFYWLECGDLGTEIHVYPTADQSYSALVRYRTDQKACSADGTPKRNLTDMDDYLNIPSDTAFEELYLNCLYTKTMEYLIADTGDENYLPYQKEFQEAYRLLRGYSMSRGKTYIGF